MKKPLLFLISLLLVILSTAANADIVNINTATAEQLAQNLDGVGETKADAIIEYRNAHGPFNTADDLSQVKGIGSKIVEKNIQIITVKDANQASN